MIPADHIQFNGDTAWLVGTEWWGTTIMRDAQDRPCSTCEGCGWTVEGPNYYEPYGDRIVCLDCIDGRHTFDIEVEADYFIEPSHHHVLADVHRVSIVPGMVLPIVDIWPTESPAIYHDPSSPVSEWWYTLAKPDGWNLPITLPSAAAPGLWAVQLRLDPLWCGG